MSVKPQPEGYTSITPLLTVADGDKAIEFYKKVFGATERLRMEKDGKIGHAELQIGDAVIMLADDCPEGDSHSIAANGNTPIGLVLYVPDVDKTFKTALANGARELRSVEKMFYGDRLGVVQDPFGHIWNVSTHVEDVSPAELDKRVASMKEPA